jgi:hypothetical protein
MYQRALLPACITHEDQMAKSNVLNELQEVTGVKAKDGEKVQVYLGRLKRGVDKLEDGDWKKLSDAAQAWANKATEAVDGDKELPSLPGLDEPAKAAKEPAPKKNQQATSARAPKKAAKGDKKARKGSGRPRMADDMKIKRLVKKLPEGNRNEYWDKIPDGTPVSKLRKNKSHLRVVRFWRRNKFVDVVGAKKAA